jgi:very-short-patch-repair endonuclease
VRLIDLLYLPASTPHRQAYLNRVIGKHVDFVLCLAADLKPVLVIELDDASHKLAHRAERDQLVDRILQSVGIPVMHQPVSSFYNTEQVARLIRASIKTDQPVGIVPEAPTA